jgi:hypothetical protein
MKNLLKSFMLIGLFVFASSSIPLTNAMLLENKVDLMENCLTYDVEDDLLECDDLENALLADMDPFCPFYIALMIMYCENPQSPSDVIQCAYYTSKVIEKCPDPV